MEKELIHFIDLAKQLGAHDAKIIDSATIHTAAWVRMRCQYGCDGYHASLCCPPYTPTPDETKSMIADYKTALLIHCRPNIKLTKIIQKLEREIFLSGYYKAFGFGAGPCDLCQECQIEECRHPVEARPSMEACGIDVYATARANGFPIEVLKDVHCEGNYYGLVLIE